jgi:hypothetical protein
MGLGECFANPGWMHIYCKDSCGLCPYDSDLDQDDTCDDKHSNCQKWANDMECYLNPAFMSGACQSSCQSCVNKNELRKQGVSEIEIQQRQTFAETYFGLWQSIPKDKTEDTVRSRIRNMGRYIKQLQQDGRIGRLTVCNNQYHDCAKWAAASTNDCESKIDLMISHCSLVCQYCHVVEQYHTCRNIKRQSTAQPFHDVAAVRQHLLITYEESLNLLEGSCSATDAKDNHTSGDEEWIISLKWHNLWGEEAEVQKAKLMKVLKSDDLNWLDAADYNDTASIAFDGNKAIDRTGQILTASSQLKTRPPFQDFLSRMSSLMMVPIDNLEVEVARYQHGERFATHSDFRIHDAWKLSGHRVLSAYVVLQRPDNGGNYGFPDLDWLLVDSPEVLVWPNIQREVDATRNSVKPLLKCQNEQLPVLEGELYAAHIWVHEYSFDSSGVC